MLIAARGLFAVSDAERVRHPAQSTGAYFQTFDFSSVFTPAEVDLTVLLTGTHQRMPGNVVERLGWDTDHGLSEVSDGEQQRVTILTRALVARPAIPFWLESRASGKGIGGEKCSTSSPRIGISAGVPAGICG